jgi:hypothetical protein
LRPFVKTITTLLLCFAGAYAGVPGTYVETYTFNNTTGAAANDLGVLIDDYASAPIGGNGTVTSQTPFPAADNSVFSPGFPAAFLTFSGATVNPGDAASFTITEPVNASLYTPVLDSYQWSLVSGGLGPVDYPLGIGIFSPDPSNPMAEAIIGDDDTVDHDYQNLYVNQNGVSLLTVSSSGTLTAANASGEAVTNPFNLDAGTLSFGLTDTTDDFSFSGTFTPTATPEPATWGICGLLLLTMGVAIWRRRIIAR